jgi:hypothetical protein
MGMLPVGDKCTIYKKSKLKKEIGLIKRKSLLTKVYLEYKLLAVF